MAARPHRHQVFTHVQSNYRRWKRREDAKSIRSLSTGSTSNRPASSSSPLSSVSDPASMTDVFPLTAPGSSQDWKWREKKEAEAVQRYPTPVSPLTRGNSDPFNAWSFGITPQVNDLVKFYRNWILPSMYHSDSRKAITSRSALRDYADTISGLKDEAGAYAFLSRNAFVAARSNPVMRQVALEYSGKSTALLAKKIKNKKDLQNATTYWHINNLWAAETIDLNMAGAVAHGKMVRHLMEEQVSTGKVDFKQLMYVVYTDSQMSATFMIPPLFDVQVWLPRVIAPVWNMAESAAEKICKQPSAELIQLDPSLYATELASIFLARQQTMHLWMAVQAIKEEAEQAPLVTLWLIFRAVLSQGKLINLYLKLQQQVAIESDEDMLDQLYAQQYLALAAIYLTRLWAFNNTVLGKPMFDAGPGILSRLRNVLEASERWPGGPTFHFYKNARIWAAYVGALGEHFNAMHSITLLDPATMWFNRQFARLALASNITTWTGIRKVLQGFIYNDQHPPHLSTWFERTVRLAASPS
ncbi:hypothetical protein DV735_g2530, partial [Chaetothyriales sp. CBS 134920]